MWQFEYSNLLLIFVVPATLAASLSDFRTHRVPNWLNATIALTGLVSQFLCFGWDGVGAGLLGMLVGFGMLFPFWMVRGMGAGDVKFMAALGAWLGLQLTFYAVIAGGLLGGVLALGLIVYQRSWARSYANLGVLFTKLSSVRTAFSEFGSAQTLAKSGVLMPYAIPLSIGTLFVLISDYSGWWGVM